MAITMVGMRKVHWSVLEIVRKVGTVMMAGRGTTVPRGRFTRPVRRVPEGRPNATEALLAMRDHDEL